MIPQTKASALPEIIVFMASSLDGFIADTEGGVAWLSQERFEMESPEDFGFEAMLASCSRILMGRKTFDQVLTFGKWFYGQTPLTVITHRPLPADLPADARIESLAASVPEIVDRCSRAGDQRLYVDGGNLLAQFLALDLVDRITLTQVPVLLGKGIRLFDSALEKNHWDFGKPHCYANGFIQWRIRRKRV